MDPYMTQFLAAERVREWRERAARAELVRQARRDRRNRPGRRGWPGSGGRLASGGWLPHRHTRPVRPAQPMPGPCEELAGDRRPVGVR
jgi:hypothetical protein